MKKALLLLLCITFVLTGQKVSKTSEGELYLQGEIIIKLKSGNSPGSQEFQDYLSTLKVTSLKYTTLSSTETQRDLQPEYLMVSYSADVDAVVICNDLQKKRLVDWAEPRYIYEPQLVPDDPSYASQWYLQTIKAEPAWEKTQGDSSVIIAIIDTGVDYLHPDLFDNVWINFKENVGTDGVDDDGNGYVDDLVGWDFGGVNGVADGNPDEDRPDHGTFVAGLAAAVSNNNIGIASIGYNVSFMAVKTSRDDIRSSSGSNPPYIVYGFEGIKYAADNGAKVINCSWGGTTKSRWGEEVINYAIQKGAVVVAAAGNSSNNKLFYPASYHGVYSVAATNSSNARASFSNFSYSVDFAAPGENIMSTWKGGGYITTSGTSASSPIAAGLIALVLSYDTTLNSIQAAELVRINPTPNENNYESQTKNQMGTGIINAERAINKIKKVAVRTKLKSSETYILSGAYMTYPTLVLTNYFKNEKSVRIEVTSLNNRDRVRMGDIELPFSDSLSTYTWSHNSFYIESFNEGSDYFEVLLIILYISGTDSTSEYLLFDANKSYATMAHNELTMGVGGDGTLGWSDYPANTRGGGFLIKDDGGYLYESGLIVTIDSVLYDNLRGEDKSIKNTTITQLSSPHVSEIEGGKKINHVFGAKINDNPKIVIHRDVMGYSTDSLKRSIIMLYTIENYENVDHVVRIASMFDWDISEFADQDSAVFLSDINGFISYSKSYKLTPYIGVAMVGDGDFKATAILNNGLDGTVNISDGFSIAEKRKVINGELPVGSTFVGDLSSFYVTPEIKLQPKAKHQFGMVISADYTQNGAYAQLISAKNTLENLLYVSNENVEDVPIQFGLEQNYPNPFNPSTTIEYSVPATGLVELKIYSILGEEIAVLVNETQPAGKYRILFNAQNLPSGVYFYKIVVGDFSSVRKMAFVK